MKDKTMKAFSDATLYEEQLLIRHVARELKVKQRLGKIMQVAQAKTNLSNSELAQKFSKKYNVDEKDFMGYETGFLSPSCPLFADVLRCADFQTQVDLIVETCLIGREIQEMKEVIKSVGLMVAKDHRINFDALGTAVRFQACA